MAYRFPGMDPYLEDPAICRGFHHGLAEEIRARLNLSLDPKYYADLEIHTTFEYERAAYARRIDYRGPVPPPALRPAMTKWVQARLATD